MGQSWIEQQRRHSSWECRGRKETTSQRPGLCGVSGSKTDGMGSCEEQAKAVPPLSWDGGRDWRVQSVSRVGMRVTRVHQSGTFHTHHTWENPDVWLSCLPWVLSTAKSSIWGSKELFSEQKTKIHISIQIGNQPLWGIGDLYDTGIYLQEFDV